MAAAPIGGLGGMSPFGLVGGAAALGGLAYTLAKGESPLPGQFNTLTNTYSPLELQTGQTELATGQRLTGIGEEGIARAQKGILTPEQQAQLKQLKETETNQARTQFSGMGIDPNKSTQFLSMSDKINTDLLAAAQNFIQSNIALAGSALTAGASFVGEGLQFIQASAQNLIASGQAQLQQDKDYSDAIAAAFGAVGKIFGGSVGAGTFGGK